MSITSLKGSTINNNLHSSVQSSLHDQDIMKLMNEALITGNDLPLQSKTKTLPLTKKVQIMLPHPQNCQQIQQIHRQNFRQSAINRVHFAEDNFNNTHNNLRKSQLRQSILKNPQNTFQHAQNSELNLNQKQIHNLVERPVAINHLISNNSQVRPIFEVPSSQIQISQHNNQSSSNCFHQPSSSQVYNQNLRTLEGMTQSKKIVQKTQNAFVPSLSINSNHSIRQTATNLVNNTNPIIQPTTGNILRQSVVQPIVFPTNIILECLNTSVVHLPDPPQLIPVTSVTAPKQSITSRTIVNLEKPQHCDFKYTQVNMPTSNPGSMIRNKSVASNFVSPEMSHVYVQQKRSQISNNQGTFIKEESMRRQQDIINNQSKISDLSKKNSIISNKIVTQIINQQSRHGSRIIENKTIEQNLSKVSAFPQQSSNNPLVNTIIQKNLVQPLLNVIHQNESITRDIASQANRLLRNSRSSSINQNPSIVAPPYVGPLTINENRGSVVSNLSNRNSQIQFQHQKINSAIANAANEVLMRNSAVENNSLNKIIANNVQQIIQNGSQIVPPQPSVHTSRVSIYSNQGSTPTAVFNVNVIPPLSSRVNNQTEKGSIIHVEPIDKVMTKAFPINPPSDMNVVSELLSRIKGILSLSENSTLNQVNYYLTSLINQNRNQKQILVNQIQQKQLECRDLQERLVFCKKRQQQTEMIINNLQQMLSQVQVKNANIIHQADLIKQSRDKHLYNEGVLINNQRNLCQHTSNLEHQLQNLKNILRQKSDNSVIYKNKVNQLDYYNLQLKKQLDAISMHLTIQRQDSFKKMNQYQTTQASLVSQIRQLQLLKIETDKTNLEWKSKVLQIQRARQILQNQIVNKKIIIQNLQTQSVTMNLQIKNQTQQLLRMAPLQNQILVYLQEIERMKGMSNQLTSKNAQIVQTYKMENMQKDNKILELQSALRQFISLKKNYDDLSRRQTQLEKLVHQKQNQIKILGSTYNSKILQLNSQIQIKQNKINTLETTMVNHVAPQFQEKFQKLKIDHDCLVNKLRNQERLRIQERESWRVSNGNDINTLRVYYESELANLRTGFEGVRSKNQIALREERDRNNVLVTELEKDRRLWETKFDHQAKKLIQLSMLHQKTLHENTVQEKMLGTQKRLNQQLSLRLDDLIRKNQQLESRIAQLVCLENQIPIRIAQHQSQIQNVRNLQTAQINQRLSNQNKIHESQRSHLACQLQDAQKKIRVLNTQLQQRSRVIDQQRRRFTEISNLQKPQIINNPNLVIEMEQKNSIIFTQTAQIQQLRKRAMMLERQWKQVQSINLNNLNAHKVQKLQMEKTNYNLQCKIIDLNFRIQSLSNELKNAPKSITKLPTNTSIENIISERVIIQQPPVLVNRIPEKVIISNRQSTVQEIQKNIFSKPQVVMRTETIQRGKTPPRPPSAQRSVTSILQTPVTQVSLGVTNPSTSRTIIAQTTRAASPISRVIINKQPIVSKVISTKIITPPKILPPKVQLQTIEIKQIQSLNNLVGDISSANTLTTTLIKNGNQINHAARLARTTIQPGKTIQMRQMKPASNNYRGRSNSRQRVMVQTNVQHTITPNIVNIVNRSRSRSKSPQAIIRSPLSPPMRTSHVSRVQIKEIPISNSPSQHIQSRTLKHVTSAPLLKEVVNLQNIPSPNNEIVVEKHISSRIQSMRSSRTGITPPPSYNIPCAKQSQIDSLIVSEGDFGMKMMQKQMVTKKYCC